MTITNEDLKTIQSAANPALGEDQTPTEAADVKASQDTPATIAAKQVLNSAATPAPKALPNTNYDFKKANPALTDDEKPDFSSKFGATIGNLLMLKGISGQPSAPGDLMKTLVVSGTKAMSDDTAPTGSTPVEAATSNADATRPSMPLPAQPNPQVLAAQNALGSFAAGAGAEGSPFNAISKNVEAQAQQRKDALANASTLVHTLHEQQVLHQLGEEQVAKGVETGIAGANLLLNAHHPGTLEASGKTSDEIKDMIAKRQIDTKNTAIFLTGRVRTGTDADGSPMYRSTYSVITPGGPITFDENEEAERNFINDKLGYKEGDPQYIQKGQQLPAVQVNRLYSQARLADANSAAAEESMARNDMKREAAQLAPDALKIQGSDALAKALTDTAIKGDPNDPDHLVKAYLALKMNKDAMASLGMSPERFEAAYKEYATGGGTDADKKWDAMQTNFQKTREKAQEKIEEAMNGIGTKDPTVMAGVAQTQIQRLAADTATQQAILNSPTSTQAQKDAAAEQIKDNEEKNKQASARLQLAQNIIQKKHDEAIQLETDKKAVQNKGVQFDPVDDSELVGENYLNALPSNKRDVLRAIYEGRDVRSPRQFQDKNGNFSPVAIALHRAYPDYDRNKAMKYAEIVKEFESAKPHTPGGQLNSGATALKHLERLDNIKNAHPLDVRTHGTAAYNEYQNLLDTVAGELLDFYGESKTNETIASKKATLGTLFNRGAAIKEQARAMAEKFTSLENSWNNASPTPTYRPPMPGIDKEAKAAARHLVPDFANDHPQLFGDDAVASTQTATTATPFDKAQVNLPPAPKGYVTVQIPGHPPKAIPNNPVNLAKFKAAFPNAIIGQ